MIFSYNCKERNHKYKKTMATKKRNNGKSPNYKCEAFKTISECVEAAINTSDYRSESTFGNTLVQDLSKKAFGALISEKIITKQGRPNSEGRYAYITKVLPFFGTHELKTLETEPTAFQEKFCLHPSRRDEVSLALLLYRNEDPSRVFGMDRQWIQEKIPIFEDFRDFTKEGEDDPGLSPFERVSPGLLEDFLSEDSTLY